jgi:hypothetical protein
MDEKAIKLAAAWIYRNKDAPDWWTPLVLTDINPDKTALKHSIQDAMRIFDALKEKEFIKEDGSSQLPHGQTIPRYSINWGKLPEFKKFALLSWSERYLPQKLYKFLISWKMFLIACGILIGTSIFQGFFGKFGESTFAVIKAYVKKICGLA